MGTFRCFLSPLYYRNKEYGKAIGIYEKALQSSRATGPSLMTWRSS